MRKALPAVLEVVLAVLWIGACLALYRLGLHPWLESALHLQPAMSSAVRHAGMLTVLLASYALFVHVRERRAVAVSELAPRIPATLLAAVAGAASIGVTLLVLYATGAYRLVAFRGFAGLPDVLGTLVVAAMIEEVVFRGVVFRLLEKGLGTNRSLVASALAFSAVHMANAGAGLLTFVTVFLAGLLLGGLFILSRNLWVTAAYHCFWNAAIFATGVALSGQTGFSAKAPFVTATLGPALWTGGAFGPENCPVTLVVLVLGSLLLWRVGSGRTAG